MKETFPFFVGTIHIIGIGGIGMSSYAEVVHNLGYNVQGSNDAECSNVERLRELGVNVMIGHQEENVFDANGKICSVVVKSTAVPDDNIEVVTAQNNGVKVMSRVELLSEIMRSKWCVNISGTHGKTTTTAILGKLLEDADLDPTILNGGILNSHNSNTRMGKSDWMVVEADESDGTFAKLPAMASIITNIDPEHMNYYKTFERLKRSFIRYARQVPFYGFVVACVDHPVVKELIPKFNRKTITYGESACADIRALNIRPTPDGFLYDIEFSANMKKFTEGCKDVFIPLFGRHNVVNSLTAFAVGHQLDIAFPKIVAALAELDGVKRRFTTTGVVNDIKIIDDYAHHPVEIEAVLQAGQDIIKAKGSGRIIAVVQPHRYTRLADLFDEFCKCFKNADIVIVADVYAAGEEKISGADKEALAKGIRESGSQEVHELSSPKDLAKLVGDIAKPEDLVILMGAGDITKWSYALPKEMNDYLAK